MARPDKYNSDFLEGLLGEIDPGASEKVRNKMLLAAKIANGKDNRGWNNVQFAKEMKRQPSEITKWLSGTHNFTVDLLTEIGEVLGVRFFLDVNVNHPVEMPVTLVVSSEKNQEWANTRLEPNKFLYGNTVHSTQKAIIHEYETATA